MDHGPTSMDSYRTSTQLLPRSMGNYSRMFQLRNQQRRLRMENAHPNQSHNSKSRRHRSSNFLVLNSKSQINTTPPPLQQLHQINRLDHSTTTPQSTLNPTFNNLLKGYTAKFSIIWMSIRHQKQRADHFESTKDKKTNTINTLPHLGLCVCAKPCVQRACVKHGSYMIVIHRCPASPTSWCNVDRAGC